MNSHVCFKTYCNFELHIYIKDKTISRQLKIRVAVAYMDLTGIFNHSDVVNVFNKKSMKRDMR